MKVPWYMRKACGTEAAYRRHLRNGEKACDACKLANAQAASLRRRRSAV